MAWVGFMGCTSYYATGDHFVKGWKKSVICNISGVLWAMLTIQVSKILSIHELVAVMTAIISFFIIAQVKNSFLEFISGNFLGCASTFGMNGEWEATIIALLMGSVLGITSDVGGILIKKQNKTSYKIYSFIIFYHLERNSHVMKSYTIKPLLD